MKNSPQSSTLHSWDLGNNSLSCNAGPDSGWALRPRFVVRSLHLQKKLSVCSLIMIWTIKLIKYFKINQINYNLIVNTNWIAFAGYYSHRTNQFESMEMTEFYH